MCDIRVLVHKMLYNGGMWIWIVIGAFLIGGIGDHLQRKISHLKERIEDLEGRVDELESDEEEYNPDTFGVGIG
jgi:hypothetical protein